MKVFGYVLVLLLILAAQGPAQTAFSEEQLGSDNMGDGAEYDNNGDRSLEIDRYGDGDYNSGEGSVMNDPGPSNSSGDGAGNDADLASDVGSDY